MEEEYRRLRSFPKSNMDHALQMELTRNVLLARKEYQAVVATKHDASRV